MRSRLRILMIFIALVAAATFLLAARTHVGPLVDWLRQHGALARLIFFCATTLSVTALIPAVWSASLAGYVFGPSVALLLCWPAITLGALAAFALGRSLFRAAAARALRRRPRLLALDAAIAEGGIKMVVLLRLCAPHNFLNYGLAATRIDFRAFALGTLVGSLPFITLGAFAGSAAKNTHDLLKSGTPTGPLTYLPLILGALAAITTLIVLTRAARRTLAKSISPHDTSPSL